MKGENDKKKKKRSIFVKWIKQNKSNALAATHIK